MKHFPITVWISMVVLIGFTGYGVWNYPVECFQVACMLGVAAASLRVAYFIIEGE